MKKYKNLLLHILNPINFIPTLFFLGKIRVMPGTLGSLATVLLLYYENIKKMTDWDITSPMLYFQYVQKMIDFDLTSSLYKYPSLESLNFFNLHLTGIWAYISYLGVVLVVGVVVSSIYCKRHKKVDPSEIIIDEYLGQLITCLIVILTVDVYQDIVTPVFFTLPELLIMIGIPFVFFRLFDITKILYIKQLETYFSNEGMGIMIDDVLAAIYGGICSSAVLLAYMFLFK